MKDRLRRTWDEIEAKAEAEARPVQAPCSVPDARVQQLVDACREWRDYMFKRMPRDVAMRRAENPGTHKIVAALDAFE